MLSLANKCFANDDMIPIDLQGYYDEDSIFIVPFSRAGNLILVQARADTMEGNFILDTGSPWLVLNLTYFRQYRTVEAAVERRGIAGSEFTVSRTQLASFSFAGHEHPRVRADLANLGHIENNKSVRILGLIGMVLLDRFEMIVDFQKNEIHLRKVGRRDSSSDRNVLLRDTAAYYEVPITLTDNRIIINTVMAGKKLKLIIDSGAERNLLDSRLPNRIFEHVSITGRALLSGAGTERVEVLTGDLAALKLGNHQIENLPVLIANLERTCFSYGGCVDGVIGFEVLSLKMIGFNFVKNKMYIWK